MVLLKLLVIIDTFLSIIPHTTCQNENGVMNSNLMSLSPTPLNYLQSPEKLNNYRRRFYDDQIDTANLAIRLLQSDADIDSYNDNNNININRNNNLYYPWNRNRLSNKIKNRSGANNLQEMQRKQLQQIFQMMMPQGSRSSRNTDLSIPNDELADRRVQYYDRMKNKKIFNDKSCRNVGDSETNSDEYYRNIYATLQQRLKTIRKELEHIENEFIVYCCRTVSNYD